MSIVLPDQFLRAAFTFLTLLLGALGTFFLVAKLCGEKHRGLAYQAGAAAALFAMLNLATVQNFYIQLESFIIHFAALPWLFLTLINLLEDTSKKNAFIYFVVSFFASSQGFVSPLFFVYMALLAFFLGFYVLTHFLNWKAWAKAILIGIVTLLINAYWFFPLMYFSRTQSQVYVNAYNNQQSTQGFIDKSRKYGTVDQVALLRGFYVESADVSDTGKFFSIFEPVNAHINKPHVLAIGYGMFAFAVLGFGLYLWNIRKYTHAAVATGFLFTFTFMAASTAPFSWISDMVQQIPAIRQAFRVAFTKFSISLAFFYALGFGLAVYYVLLWLGKLPKSFVPKFFQYSSTALICGCVLYFGYPVFQGHFLYQRTKLEIPDSYFKLYDYLKTQPREGKILNLPQGWNYGWSVYKWGYSGSGFLWYGIEQPILDRAFDSWGNYNEAYFWELNYILYSDKAPFFDNLVRKYGIRYILIDTNILPYQKTRDILYSDKLLSYIQDSPNYRLVKEFPSKNRKADSLKLYEVLVNRAEQQEIRVSPIADRKNVQPAYSYTNFDQAYLQYGDYYTETAKAPDVYYPFRALFTGRNTDETTPELTISSDSAGLAFRKQVPAIVREDSYQLATDPAGLGDYTEGFVTRISRDDNVLTATVKQPLEATNSGVFLAYYDSTRDKSFFKKPVNNCFGTEPGADQFLSLEAIRNEYFRFRSRNAENCLDLYFPDAPQNVGYLIEVEHRYRTGNRFRTNIINETTRRIDIDNYLSLSRYFIKDYLIYPPMKLDGIGFTLRFNNVSIYPAETANDLKSVKIYQFPYADLSNTRYVTLKARDNNGSLLTYHQSYHPDWLAYRFSDTPSWFDHLFPFFRGKRLNRHVQVNNWANGWISDKPMSSATVAVVFWPQYLAYIGYALLIGVGLATLALPRSKNPASRKFDFHNPPKPNRDRYRGEDVQNEILLEEEVKDRILGKW